MTDRVDNKILPVMSLLRSAFEVPFLLKPILIPALAISATCLVVMDIIGRKLEDGGGAVFWAIYLILGSAMFTLFAITTHRVVLRGPNSVPKYGLLSWSRREWRFLGWTIVTWSYLLFIYFAIAIPITILFVHILDEPEH